MGKDVSKAIANIHEHIKPALLESKLAITDQKAIDDLLLKLDGTPNKAKLGANAILAVSIAVAEAGAAAEKLPLYAYFAKLAGVKAPYKLPVPCFNVINGGSHAGNKLAFQEFMILPVAAKDFTHALKMGTETYHTLKKVIGKKYGIDACNVGDEGGFAPNVSGAEESLDLLVEAIKAAGYEGQIKIALDVASSEFYKVCPPFLSTFCSPSNKGLGRKIRPGLQEPGVRQEQVAVWYRAVAVLPRPHRQVPDRVG